MKGELLINLLSTLINSRSSFITIILNDVNDAKKFLLLLRKNCLC